jgi:hypothetical protein
MEIKPIYGRHPPREQPIAHRIHSPFDCPFLHPFSNRAAASRPGKVPILAVQPQSLCPRLAERLQWWLLMPAGCCYSRRG